MKPPILLFTGLILSAQLLKAQGLSQVFRSDAVVKHYLHVGYNFGGVTPVPLPANIRAVERYSPGFSPSFGYEMSYDLNDHMQLRAGLRFDVKGMNVTDSVEYLQTEISVSGSEFAGAFSGTNRTVAKNAYLGLPLTFAYSRTGNWRFKGGVYGAYLLRPYFRGDVSDGYIRSGSSTGPKVTISQADFNFDDKLRRFDWGVLVGSETRFWKTYYAVAELSWGLRSVFPESFRGIGFRTRNVFINVSVKKQLVW